MLSEVSQPQKDKHRVTHSQEGPSAVRPTGTESRRWVPGAGEGLGEFAFTGDRVSVWEDGKVQDGWWGRLHKNVSVFSATEPGNG